MRCLYHTSQSNFLRMYLLIDALQVLSQDSCRVLGHVRDAADGKAQAERSRREGRGGGQRPNLVTTW